MFLCLSWFNPGGGGDFVYNEQEFEVMKEDLRPFKEDRNADGFVFGVLTPNGKVDETRCSKQCQLFDDLLQHQCVYGS